MQRELHEVIKVAAQYDATNIVTREPSLEEIFLRFYEPERLYLSMIFGLSGSTGLALALCLAVNLWPALWSPLHAQT